MPLDWDTTICESLDDVRDMLQFLDVYLDDDTIQAKVTIKGIGMTAAAFDQWKEENLEPVAHSEQPTPSPEVKEEWAYIPGGKTGRLVNPDAPATEPVKDSPVENDRLNKAKDLSLDWFKEKSRADDLTDKLQQAHADIRYWKEQYDRLRFSQ